MSSTRLSIVAALMPGMLATIFTGCTPADESPRVALPILIDSSQTQQVITDLGYQVSLSEARVALGPLVFTVAGEVHASRSLWDLIVPSAHAHPGHYQGGEVIGELPGTFVVNWANEDGRELGSSELITGDYSAANFTFVLADSPMVNSDDPMMAHTSMFKGVAKKDGREVSFTILAEAPEGRELVGAPFSAKIDAQTSGHIDFRFHTLDPVEGDTLFDGMDFLALDDDGDGAWTLSPDTSNEIYNTFRRTLLSHDHYSFEHKP